MTTINPVTYPGCFPTNGVNSRDVAPGYADATLRDIQLQQAALKVRILDDKINAPDTTSAQKQVLQPMLNDAKREYGALVEAGKIY